MAIINYAYYKSPIGIAKVTADENFITELVFIEENEAVVNNENIGQSLPLQQCLHQLDEFFNGKRKHFAIPVKQAGTAFQQKVWNELINIPFGKTVSYLQLSKQIGDTKAIRAVAASNGKNKISIIVPCHRVVGSNQSLVGYAWGNWRKQWLLEHEAKWENGVRTLF